MTVDEIQKEMLGGNIPPARLGELRIILGAKYSQATDEHELIILAKPAVWNEMRPNYKSDKACDRVWDQSKPGQQEIHWKYQIRKIEKMMSALKMQWDIVNAEARNQL